MASESVAVDVIGFRMLRDVAPGEAILIDTEGNFRSRQCAQHTVQAPCMFEFVYLARPDSIIDASRCMSRASRWVPIWPRNSNAPSRRSRST